MSTIALLILLDHSMDDLERETASLRNSGAHSPLLLGVSVTGPRDLSSIIAVHKTEWRTVAPPVDSQGLATRWQEDPSEILSGAEVSIGDCRSRHSVLLGLVFGRALPPDRSPGLPRDVVVPSMATRRAVSRPRASRVSCASDFTC